MSLLQCIISWAWATIGTLLYAGQLISTINFPLAQRIGLQEKADGADPLSSQLELMTARWDTAWLWIPPIAGGVYVDAGGREWAKVLGLRSHSVPIGSVGKRGMIYTAYAFLILTGLAGIAVGLAELM